jgi:hypothetical protein
MSAMDDIIVKRYNHDRVPEDQIKVRFVYAPKQRVLLDLLDKAQNIQLPVIAVSNGGITRDPNRVFNKIEGSYIPSSDPRFAKPQLQPVPIDLTINLSILTRYQQDYDQIITNFLPYFDPYIIISWRTPNRPDQEIRSQVIWSGSVATEYPTDLNATQVARVQGTTSFTFKGWLFKAAPGKDTGRIFTITTDFSTEPGIHTKYSLDQLDPLQTDRVVLSGQPQPRAVNPYYASISASNTFALYGKSFFNITNVYLSGNTNFNNTFFNPFSAVPRLSALYPGFSGIELPADTYLSNNNNVLTFTMPSAINAGKVDVILQNEAGYGSLTQYAYRNVYNPYLPSMPEYDTFVNYQPPFLSGIDIFTVLPPASSSFVPILYYGDNIMYFGEELTYTP